MNLSIGKVDIDRMLKDVIGGIDTTRIDKMTELYNNKYFESEPDLLEVPDVPWRLSKDDLEKYNKDYLKYTNEVAQTCIDRDLTDSMVIGTSAIINTELDGAVGMNSGIFNNPFIIWGKYKKKFFKYYLTISFQYHHTQMDGAHAGKFLANLQKEINNLR
mgnify:CR=1 FL=1